MKGINKKSLAKRTVGIFLATVMILSAVLGGIGPGFFDTGTQEVYAAEKGSKNTEQKQAVQDVIDGKAPSMQDYDNGYSGAPIEYTKLLDGAVYRGGNAKSGTEVPSSPNLDSDPNDFASVLPYGNVYVDVSKLTFANADVDIQDKTNFTWVSNNANYSTIETKMGYSGIKVSAQGYNATNFAHWVQGSIAYIGGLDAYLSNTGAYQEWVNNGKNTNNYTYLNSTVSNSGVTKTITPTNGSSYLYQFKFPGAATLPDGTPGSLVITTTAVELESAIDVEAGKPIGIQSPNNIGISAVFKDYKYA